MRLKIYRIEVLKKACLNLANINLALKIKNIVLDFFNYITFLDLAIFNQKNLILALTTILILALLPISFEPLPSLVIINLLARRSNYIVFNMEISGITIWQKSKINYS